MYPNSQLQETIAYCVHGSSIIENAGLGLISYLSCARYLPAMMSRKPSVAERTILGDANG